MLKKEYETRPSFSPTQMLPRRTWFYESTARRPEQLWCEAKNELCLMYANVTGGCSLAVPQCIMDGL